jgi:hypothetical protein
MAQVKRSVIDYLQDELDVNQAALKAYDDLNNPIAESDAEIKKMREMEAIKLRDRVAELSRHIKVIRRMYPDA